MSLLARLLVLVLLTALPPLALQVWREADADREHRAGLAATARDLTLRATVEQERMIDGARQLLGAIVSLRSVRARDVGPCSVSLRQIAAEFSAYAVISAASVPDGEVFCSSGRPGNRVADRYWYRSALERGGFTVGEQVESRETGRRVLHFSRPAVGLNGEVTAILDAALDLDQMAATLQQAPLPPGAALLVADRKGNVLAALPDRALVGRPLPEGLAPLLKDDAPGMAEAHWAGALRITGHQPANRAPAEGIFVAVGIDRDAALTEARRRARVALLGSGLAALAALGLALWFAVRFIRRPVARLTAAAARWEAGDLSARAGLADPSELGRLATACDAMAAAGQAREAELRRGIARSEAAEARFRALFDAAPIAVMLVDPKTLVLVAFNDLACETLGFGREEFARLRLPDIDVVHPEAAFRLLAAPRLPGRGTLETRFRTREGTLRDMLVTFEQVELGGQRLLYAASIDVTERRAAEARERLLLREVDHRARNALAVVRALVQLSPRDQPPAESARNLDGRIAAMARAHALLAAERWQGASLDGLLAQELEAYVGAESAARLQISGPPVLLRAEIAQPLSLVLHELATNAAKYGALSREAGWLRVDWAFRGNGGLQLRWSERGGPALEGAPPRRGFGSKLVERVTRAQLHGTVAFDWGVDGLEVLLDIPLNAPRGTARMPEPATAEG
ncbi:HWE histidine kinase domain-containing protein [Dankookia sp. P2]|uniref:HWE histidine kinase domain-containing protein n=1 Tax=Dankookia sp. P2 TaxID=3423955 RepID=UPI003D6665FF